VISGGPFSAWPPRGLPPALDLPEGEIQIWAIPLDPPAERVAALAHTLTPDEEARAARFRFDVHRRRYVVGRGVLRELLGAYLRVPPAALRFDYRERGKPDLAAPWRSSGLAFNLSNSEDLALAGFVAGGDLGVDVEYLKEMPDLAEIATRFFSASEVAALAGVTAERKKEAFFNCWTRKEAYLKAVGVGLAAPLDSFAVTLAPGEAPRMLTLQGDRERAAGWFFHHLEPRPQYLGAVAIERPMPAGAAEPRVVAWTYDPGASVVASTPAG
jgi:4'-phosphopantetheinyl transferase